MKLTLEHAIIGLLALALIFYLFKYSDVRTDLLSIPDRGHPELKAVKDKHRICGHYCHSFMSTANV